MATEQDGAGTTEVATLAGGCFWCLEAVYDDLKGVSKAQSGYMGGQKTNPSYEQVCSGTTGHAEVVQLTFDPKTISFADLLEVFFAIHDPTTLNRQGADVGTQYRSAIYFHTPEQERVAKEAIAALSAEKAFPSPIVTEVTAAGPFYQAEAYHDDYFARNGGQPYCQLVVAPKVQKFRKLFGEKRK